MPEAKKSKKNKSSKEEYEKRIDEVIELLADGKSNKFCCIYMQQKHKVTRFQVYRYIEDAYNKLQEIYATNSYSNYVKSISFHQELLQKAMENGDYLLALKVHEKIDKLTGVEVYSSLISFNRDFSRLFSENMINAVDKATELFENKDEIRHRIMLEFNTRVRSIYTEAYPFVYQHPKQLESGGDSKPAEPVEKTIDCVL